MTSARKHVVIVGAGFAGLELATRLSDSLADAVHVTIIDRNDSFYFGFSKLDVLLGRQAPADPAVLAARRPDSTFGTSQECDRCTRDRRV